MIERRFARLIHRCAFPCGLVWSLAACIPDPPGPGDGGSPPINGLPDAAVLDASTPTDASFRDASVALDAGQDADGATPADASASSGDAGMDVDASVPVDGGVLDSGTPAPPDASVGYTLVVLPDTQHYSNEHPSIATAQTEWIVAEVVRRNIKYVLHEGDFTDLNSLREWNNANEAMSLLDGVVPWAFVYGNHDLGKDGQAEDRSTLGETVFPVSRFQDQPTFGDVYEADSMQNSYHLFTAGNTDYLALMLEFGPRDGVLTWANSVCEYYASRTVIVVTHSHVDEKDQLCGDTCDFNPHIYLFAQPENGGANDGVEVWDKLIRHHANIRFVLNGHHIGDGLGRLISRGDHGNLVVQIFTNFQVRPFGGEGYLRLFEFPADGSRVDIKTFSPWVEEDRRWLTDSEHQFSVDLRTGELSY